jgi:hypothetical protein
MSKIYEALRQAELDRATNTGNAQPNTTSQNTGQAVLDTETAAEPGFTREVRAFEPLGPSLRQASERSVGGALAEAQRPDPTPFVPAEYSSESSINSVTLDVSALQQHVWRPAVNLLPALDERGSAVEQFRSLRSRMQEFRDLNRLKTILVSSGLPQEGKSFIATNLAISFARHKAARVLLIDGDMRRATLHKLLGAPQGPGLTNYLSGDATVVQTVQRPKSDGPSKALPPGLASLAFIPSGV